MPDRLNLTKRGIEALPPAPPDKVRVYYYDTKVRGLTLAVCPKARKTFVLYRKVKGGATRINLGPFPDLTVEQARKMADELNAAIARGENPIEERRAEKQELVLGEFFDEYLERHAKIRNKQKTWKGELDQFNLYAHQWRKRKLSSITRNEIHKLHTDVARNHGHYSANRLLALLSSLFNRAIEWGHLLQENPARGVKKFPEKSRDRYLREGELPGFFKALASEPNGDFRDFVIVGLFTGVRPGNICAMQWKAVDFGHGTWRIGETKNGDPLTVPLTGPVLELLHRRPQDSEWVFPGRRRGEHVTTFKNAWQEFRRRTGLADVQIRDLRRTLATWQLSSGVQLPVISKSLGQKTLAITAGVYARADEVLIRQGLKVTVERLLTAGNGTAETGCSEASRS